MPNLTLIKGYLVKDKEIICITKPRKADPEFKLLIEIIDQYNSSEERIAATEADLKNVLVRFNLCCSYCVYTPPYLGHCKGCSQTNGYELFTYKRKAANKSD